LSNAAQSEIDLRQLATGIVERALRAGASDAEVTIREGDEFSVSVRLGEVETLKESGSRGVGLRVLVEAEKGYRVASTSSSDFTAEGIDHLVKGAVALARVTSVDPFAGLAERSEFGQIGNEQGDLQLCSDDVYSLPTEERIAWAQRAESAALGVDPRLVNSDGAGFDAATGRRIFANSRGFSGEYRSSYCSLAVSPIAQGAGGEMQRDYWWSQARAVRDLESPESVGHEAARRTLRMLDARRVPTQQAAVIFAPEVARGLVGAVFDAAAGDAIYRGASIFAGKLGDAVAADSVTVVDDGTIPGGFGTSPFDAEGLPSRRTVIVDRGVLRSYVLNTYAGRKLGMRSTGNAGRGLAGNPYLDSGNLFLEAGALPPDEILRGVERGLYVTRLMGQGVNLVTGDYSRGAAGLWIENGEFAYPVQEITIAGNLKEMLRNITAIGSDLVFRGATASPTICVDGMTIAGE
jgi:PmbA protein